MVLFWINWFCILISLLFQLSDYFLKISYGSTWDFPFLIFSVSSSVAVW